MTGTPTLQCFIDQWHAQSPSPLQAFSVDTRVALFQLMRFNAVGRGKRKRTAKNSMRVTGVLDNLCIPIFTDSDTLAFSTCIFEVVAAVFGELADSGHYRCYWKKNNRVWITDDASPATECTIAEMSALTCGAYLIWAVRRA